MRAEGVALLNVQNPSLFYGAAQALLIRSSLCIEVQTLPYFRGLSGSGNACPLNGIRPATRGIG